MARAVTISHTYSEVALPNSRQSCRNATFVMPAIGASTTGGLTGYGPTLNEETTAGTDSRLVVAPAGLVRRRHESGLATDYAPCEAQTMKRERAVQLLGDGSVTTSIA
ncbi:hypothetical protein GCM10010483_62310 [Actinokineospora diospyrosa]